MLFSLDKYIGYLIISAVWNEAEKQVVLGSQRLMRQSSSSICVELAWLFLFFMKLAKALKVKVQVFAGPVT